MKPLKRRNGNQFLHRESADYRQAIKRKLNAYHVFVLAGFVFTGTAALSGLLLSEAGLAFLRFLVENDSTRYRAF